MRMRPNLKQARIDKGMTQQQVADYLDIGVRYYQKIESGDRTGDIRLWDDLEDLFSIHQRMLRQTDQADSR
jgi:transcriptional regulator with XRE-family HTH domain